MNRIFLVILFLTCFTPNTQAYVGQCQSDNDCPLDQTCNAEICGDPCSGSCGANATCIPAFHGAYCSCSEGYTGDPFTICYEMDTDDDYDEYLCGPHAEFVNGTTFDNSYCLCLPTFRGRPPNCTYIECYTNEDCDWNQNCDFNECVDPCDPNYCGSNSNCRSDGHLRARCSCQDGYFPQANVGCRLIEPSDKLIELQTIALKLKGLCGMSCGVNAFCNQSGYCECTNGYSGDPNIECLFDDTLISEELCTPNPCGPYSKCQVIDSSHNCTCLPGYIASSPNCSRCENDQDCTDEYICIANECVENPCTDFCGYQASCEVFENKIECYCKDINRYNPFMECPRLADIDHICANANKPECGVKLAIIFKHHRDMMYYDNEQNENNRFEE